MEKNILFQKSDQHNLSRLKGKFTSPYTYRVAIVLAVLLGQFTILTAFRQQESKINVSRSSVVLNSNKSLQLAKAVAERAVELNSQDGYAWFYYGTALYLMDQMPQAIAAIEQCIPLLPHSYNALRLLAFSHYKIGNFEEAAEELAEYVAMVPLPPVSPEMVYRMAGLSFLRLGEMADSSIYLAHATNLTDQKGELLRVRSTVALLCNQYWTADYCFRAFRYYQPDYEFNPFEIVSNAKTADKIPVAIDFLELTHRRNPDDLGVVKALAAAYVSAGQTPEAERLMVTAIESHPENATLRLVYGDILYAAKKLKEAFAQYDEHLRLDPESRFRQDILQKKATARY